MSNLTDALNENEKIGQGSKKYYHENDESCPCKDQYHPTRIGGRICHDNCNHCIDHGEDENGRYIICKHEEWLKSNHKMNVEKRKMKEFIKRLEESAKERISPEHLCEGYLYSAGEITFDPKKQLLITIESELNLEEMKALIGHMEKHKK